MVKSALRERYAAARVFRKPSVMRMNPGEWIVVGPGRPWLGDQFPTWQDAINDVFKCEQEVPC